MSNAAKDWKWPDYFHKFSFGDGTPNQKIIYIPRTVREVFNKGTGGHKIPVPIQKALAEDYYKMILLLEEIYGKTTMSFFGSLIETPVRGESSLPIVVGLKIKDEAALKTSKSTGRKYLDTQLGIHSYVAHEKLFSMDSFSGKIRGFSSKRSLLRSGAQIISKDFVKRFDKLIHDTRLHVEFFSTHEMLQILQATKAYIIELLEKAGVEPTPENIITFAHMSEAKGEDVMLTLFRNRKFLKVHRSTDENLARLVGKGMTFEKAMVFFLFPNYLPQSEQEMFEFIDLPEKWFAKTLETLETKVLP